MTRATHFLAGDWGTSHLRLFLCDAGGRVLERVDGPGVAQVRGPFDALLAALLAPWDARHGPLPIVLCGMVGSNIGWAPAPYAPCPAGAPEIIERCLALLAGRVHIVPGLRCRNRLGSVDFLRGEETQVLGAMRLDPGLGRGRNLLCLPGTHTKWVILQDARIAEFLTAPTGEVFALLREHSVLVRGAVLPEDVSQSAAFAQGLRRLHDLPAAQILHLLFECRARQIEEHADGSDAAAYLSGLLVSSDVRGAMALFADGLPLREVTIVGEPRLARLYAAALALESRTSRILEGANASLAGLAGVHERLALQGAPHAA